MSIVDYIFADVTDVSGQDNTDSCEDVNSISFEQRTLKSRGDYERKALWSRGGVSRTLVFNPVFSMRVSLPVFLHAQCVMFTRQPFGRRAKSPSVKSFRVIRMFHIIMLSCVFWVARALH